MGIDCDRNDCRLQESGGYTTCMYYPPVYDKYGNNLNRDMNTRSYRLDCTVCGRAWSKSVRNRETEVHELDVS